VALKPAVEHDILDSFTVELAKVSEEDREMDGTFSIPIRG
jgi:hypothetical protein